MLKLVFLFLQFAIFAFAQNYLFIHGLTSDSNTFRYMAKEVALSKGFGTITKIGYEHISKDTQIYLNTFDEIANAMDVESDNTFKRIYGLKDSDIEDFKIWYKDIEVNYNFPDIEKDWRELVKGTILDSKIFIVNLSNNKDLSFEAQGKEISDIVNRIKDVTNDNNFVLIGHSMGGLAIRAFVQYFKSDDININEIITLGTPHKGVNYNIVSEIIKTFYAGSSAINLSSDSEDLQKLNSTNLEVYKNIPFIAFAFKGHTILDGILDGILGTDDDGIVPYNSQIPPFDALVVTFSPNCTGEKNCVLTSSAIGHMSETKDEVVAKKIKKYLDYIHLTKGWNLVSFNAKEFNFKPIKRAWKYNEENGWSVYTRSELLNLDEYDKFNESNAKEGIWIYSDKEIDFNFISSEKIESLENKYYKDSFTLSGTSVDVNVEDIMCLNNSNPIIYKYKNGKWYLSVENSKYETFSKIYKNEGFWVKCR